MTLELFVMWVALLLLAGLAMKGRGCGRIRDIGFALISSVLLAIACLAAAWGSGSFRPWGALRARGWSRRSASRSSGRAS